MRNWKSRPHGTKQEAHQESARRRQPQELLFLLFVQQVLALFPGPERDPDLGPGQGQAQERVAGQEQARPGCPVECQEDRPGAFPSWRPE